MRLSARGALLPIPKYYQPGNVIASGFFGTYNRLGSLRVQMATTALMSGLQFDALPFEEGRLWELLEGELIPMPSPTYKHQRIVQRLQVALELHFEGNPEQGQAASDVEFALSANSRVRPGVLILLPQSVGSIDLDKVPIPGAPDIAVEVIFPLGTRRRYAGESGSLPAPWKPRSMADLSQI